MLNRQLTQICRIQSISDGLLVLLPDFIVFLTSMILFILFQKNSVFSRKSTSIIFMWIWTNGTHI